MKEQATDYIMICDRCGVKAVQRDSNDFKSKGWEWIVGADNQKKVYDLCPECASSYSKVWETWW